MLRERLRGMEPTPKRTRLSGMFENTRFDRFDDDDETTSLAHLVLARARPALPSLHLGPMIYAFLDCSKQWTFEPATKAGFVRLLSLLAMRAPLGLPNGFDKLRSVTNIEIAARKGDVDVLNWWHTFYLPHRDMKVEQEILRFAAYDGHLNVIKWVRERQTNNDRPSRGWNGMLYVSSPEIVRWVHEHWSSARLIVLLHELAAQGDLKFIKWIRHKTSYLCEIRGNAISAAVLAGHLDIVQYFYVLEPSIQLSGVFKLAAEAGHLHIVQWLLSEDEDAEEQLWVTDDMVENTKSHAIIEWLTEKYTWKSQSNKTTWLVNSMEQAARCGIMKLLQYLYEHQPSDQTVNILDAAVPGGSVEMATWLHDRGVGSRVEDLLLESVDSSTVEMVQWVHENYPDMETTTESMDTAAHGSLDIVQFLHENRLEGCTSDAMDNAARGCDLAIVKYLHDNRFEGCTRHAMDYAAANGSLEVVTFLHENRSEGCTADAMNTAAARGHLDIVKFLQENRSEGDADEAINRAALNGHFEIVKLLHQDHPEANIAKALTGAAMSGHINIVQLLRCRANEKQISNAMYQAADKGHRDVVAYLALHCQPDFDKSHIKRAVRRGHLTLLEWILEENKKNDYIYYEFSLDRIFDRQIRKWRQRVQRYGCVLW